MFLLLCVGLLAEVMERAQRCRTVKYVVPEMMLCFFCPSLVLSKGQKLKLWEIEICRPVHNLLVSLLHGFIDTIVRADYKG